MTAPHAFTADLHIHSRYAYACSKNLTLENLAVGAKTKGIDMLATGDFTHPAWLGELESNLVEVDCGTYSYEGVNFVLGTEVSCIYRQGGRSRRLHLLVFLSSLEVVRKFNEGLAKRGARLEGDGRPTVALSAADLTLLAMDLDSDAVVIPAHIWTPWYGMLGSVSGFDSLEECFGNADSLVRAVETGLSSDPAMNWGIPDLDGRAIVSFSDAHSLPNLGRELTVFAGKPTYHGFKEGIEGEGISYTVEFYPEEGKYHHNGHRNCGVRQSPAETAMQGDRRCPVCGRTMTLGVLHRVASLSTVPSGFGKAEPTGAPDNFIRSSDGRAPFLRLVPLEELLSETLGVGRRTKRVGNLYQKLCGELGGELAVLAWAEVEEIEKVAGEEVGQAILNARTGNVVAEPGYDGKYGTIRVWG